MTWLTILRKAAPYLIVLGIVCFALAKAYSFGYDNATAKAQAETVKAVQRAIEQAQQIQDQNDQFADAYEQEAAKARENERKLRRRFAYYAQTHPDNPVCFDDDGVLLINEAG